jgi:hypothetical protein
LGLLGELLLAQNPQRRFKFQGDHLMVGQRGANTLGWLFAA